MRALAVTGAKRSPAMPDVPTLIETGIPVEANLWTGLFAPAATPRPIVDKLNEDITRIFDTPQMKEWLLTAMGGEFGRNTPEQFSAFVATRCRALAEGRAAARAIASSEADSCWIRRPLQIARMFASLITFAHFSRLFPEVAANSSGVLAITSTA